MQIQVTKTDCINIANKVKQGGVNNTELEVALAKKCLSLYEKLGKINNERTEYFEAIYSACVKFDKATKGAWKHKRAADLARDSRAHLTYNLHKADGNNFGWALEMLKAGEKVQRKGWNGKGMFITLQNGSKVNGTLMRNEPAKQFYGNNEVNIYPHLDMKAADGSYVVGWLASQTDMLAEDWQIAE